MQCGINSVTIFTNVLITYLNWTYHILSYVQMCTYIVKNNTVLSKEVSF